MDRDEEECLRAFTLTVGATQPEDPQWVERDGTRSDVVEVTARWQEEDRLGFRVRLADGSAILLYYVPELDLWSGPWPERSTEGIVRRRRRSTRTGAG